MGWLSTASQPWYRYRHFGVKKNTSRATPQVRGPGQTSPPFPVPRCWTRLWCLCWLMWTLELSSKVDEKLQGKIMKNQSSKWFGIVSYRAVSLFPRAHRIGHLQSANHAENIWMFIQLAEISRKIHEHWRHWYNITGPATSARPKWLHLLHHGSPELGLNPSFCGQNSSIFTTKTPWILSIFLGWVGSKCSKWTSPKVNSPKTLWKSSSNPSMLMSLLAWVMGHFEWRNSPSVSCCGDKNRAIPVIFFVTVGWIPQ